MGRDDGKGDDDGVDVVRALLCLDGHASVCISSGRSIRMCVCVIDPYTCKPLSLIPHSLGLAKGFCIIL